MQEEEKIIVEVDLLKENQDLLKSYGRMLRMQICLKRNGGNI